MQQSARRADPGELFQGVVAITVPHMDDCVLACGGTIALLPEKHRVHVIYATDGTRSPAPALPWLGSVAHDLAAMRRAEARAAMGFLGVPEENVHFLDLPDGRVQRFSKNLHRMLVELIGELDPSHVFTPFRYDRHADHLALNRVVTAACRQIVHRAQLVEYFVYYRWRLLPSGDVRQYISPQHLLEVDIRDVSARKRAALDYFKSQTTRLYPWQRQPTLTARLLDEVSQTPELFLRYDPSFQGPAVFDRAATFIRLIHRLEPFLKHSREKAAALLRGGPPRNG